MEVKLDSQKQEYSFNRLFSEKFINSYKSRFSSIEDLSRFLKDKNEVIIPKATIDTYTAKVPKSPSLYKASALSKALNFSLDELRNSHFNFDAKEETVAGKLLEYHQLYYTIIKTFPQLSNYDLYKDVPCFVEFLNKIEGLDDKNLIVKIA
jgi:hypothetical protein